MGMTSSSGPTWKRREREKGNDDRTVAVAAPENMGGELELTGVVHAGEAEPLVWVVK